MGRGGEYMYIREKREDIREEVSCMYMCATESTAVSLCLISSRRIS